MRFFHALDSGMVIAFLDTQGGGGRDGLRGAGQGIIVSGTKMKKEVIAKYVLPVEPRKVPRMNVTLAKSGSVKKLSRKNREIIDQRTPAYASDVSKRGSVQYARLRNTRKILLQANGSMHDGKMTEANVENVLNDQQKVCGIAKVARLQKYCQHSHCG